MRPIVALLTDFGTRDHYAGTMKGVMLGICPELTLVDITHDVPAHDVLAGALELAACYRYFPAGTIFLVVVDPGVGSVRRGVAAEAGDYRLIAPDNGVLTGVFRDTPPKRVVELTQRKYARPTISRTFEGRDRFAPAAAWLARGAQLTAFGRPVSDYVTLDIPSATVTDDRIEGVVLRIDRFGNIVSSIDRRTMERLTHERIVRIDMAGASISRLVDTYAEMPEGEPCALFGSSDHLEVAIRNGSAADTLTVERGMPVTVTRA